MLSCHELCMHVMSCYSEHGVTKDSCAVQVESRIRSATRDAPVDVNRSKSNVSPRHTPFTTRDDHAKEPAHPNVIARDCCDFSTTSLQAAED